MNFSLFVQRIAKNNTNRTSARIKFMKVDSTKPIKAPTATFKARFIFLLSCISSPTNAPKNNPIKNPRKKGVNKPMIAPTYEP